MIVAVVPSLQHLVVTATVNNPQRDTRRGIRNSLNRLDTAACLLRQSNDAVQQLRRDIFDAETMKSFGPARKDSGSGLS